MHADAVTRGSEAVERTFCFVDLAGFTALTEAHGDADAVALLDEFLSLTRAALGPDDELVKSIGDAVMLASPGPDSALQAVASLMTSCRHASGFPLPRAGAHHGAAICRDGDYLGGAVNLAARVAGHAAGGQLLATGVVAEAARSMAVEVVAHGPHELHNVSEPVDLFEIHLEPWSGPHTIDPVCRMHVDPEHAAGSLRHGGAEYWFCSLSCVSAFASSPSRYIAMSAVRGRTDTP